LLSLGLTYNNRRASHRQHSDRRLDDFGSGCHPYLVARRHPHLVTGHWGYQGIGTGRFAAHRPGHFLDGAHLHLLHIVVVAVGVVVIIIAVFVIVVGLCQGNGQISICGEDALLVFGNCDATGDVHGSEGIRWDWKCPCRSCSHSRYCHHGSQGRLWYVHKFGGQNLSGAARSHLSQGILESSSFGSIIRLRKKIKILENSYSMIKLK